MLNLWVKKHSLSSMSLLFFSNGNEGFDKSLCSIFAKINQTWLSALAVMHQTRERIAHNACSHFLTSKMGSLWAEMFGNRDINGSRPNSIYEMFSKEAQLYGKPLSKWAYFGPKWLRIKGTGRAGRRHHLPRLYPHLSTLFPSPFLNIKFTPIFNSTFYFSVPSPTHHYQTH